MAEYLIERQWIALGVGWTGVAPTEDPVTEDGLLTYDYATPFVGGSQGGRFSIDDKIRELYQIAVVVGAADVWTLDFACLDPSGTKHTIQLAGETGPAIMPVIATYGATNLGMKMFVPGDGWLELNTVGVVTALSMVEIYSRRVHSSF